MPTSDLAQYALIIAVAVISGLVAVSYGDTVIVVVCAVLAGLFSGWCVMDLLRWRRG